jgi:hypothetical protein
VLAGRRGQEGGMAGRCRAFKGNPLNVEKRSRVKSVCTAASFYTEMTHFCLRNCLLRLLQEGLIEDRCFLF